MRIVRIFFSSAFFILNCRPAPLLFNDAHRNMAGALELAPDKTAAGTFNGGEEEFYARVPLAEARMLRAEISAARGTDSALAVLKNGGLVIAESDDNGSSLSEEIYPVFLEPGDYRIRIRGKGGESSGFTFFYRTFNAPSDVEREPNNSLETATPVTGLHATGFYGPEAKGRERDCFVKDIPDTGLITVSLTGVDGITPALTVFAPGGREILRETASGPGAAIKAGPLRFENGKIFACVAASAAEKKASRDYYDLTFAFGEEVQTGEVEPNNNPAAATGVKGEWITGMIGSFADSDYFQYQNRREYAVSLRAALETEKSGSEIFLSAERPGERSLVFENSAAKGEIAENLRLESGESMVLAVKLSGRAKRKNFAPAPYTLRFQETQVSDENEAEPNNTAGLPDTLVELTQKWGFINPVGDVDYYRLKLDAAGERLLSFESKIDCKVRLEHRRGAKSLASSTAPRSVSYRAVFEKDDLIRVECLGQKPNPAERAYRIALSEP